ncbi:MAG: hypothetical protein ABIR37_03500 [Candidatus Saccharimonadales bacterium]
MSRYLILLLLNLPLVLIALLSALVDYKMGKLSRKKYFIQIGVWLVILAGIASSHFIYAFLFSHQLTQTEPLSLFDVIQITGVIVVLFMANRSRIKIEGLERRVQDLHQELSIRLSEDERKK